MSIDDCFTSGVVIKKPCIFGQTTACRSAILASPHFEGN